jgi:polyphosphate kinase
MAGKIESGRNTNTLVETADLDRPECFTNWRLSQLEFNQRVLAQTVDRNNPLFERLKFLCIFSTNMDEFFEVRVAGLKQEATSSSAPTGPEQMTPRQVLEEIYRRSQELVAEQYRILNDVLFPELAEEGIRFISRSKWTEKQTEWIREQFHMLMPIISPLGLDPAHPFPRILNKSLNFIVSLKGKDAFGRHGGMAIVQAPRILPRILHLPPAETGSGPYDFVFLSSVIHGFVGELFPQMEVLECHQFRVTRNSDLYVDEEEIADLRQAIEGELLSRRYGEAVRLEVTDYCPEELVAFLMDKFAVTPEEMFRVAGPVNVNRLMRVYDLVNRPDLKYPPFFPSIPKQLGRTPKMKFASGRVDPVASGPAASGKVPQTPNMFDKIREKDILLHHPFESFSPVVEFLQQACRDPQVQAIKQTLYRTGDDSAIVDALVGAAKAGKEVTVVVELRARFDEEANIHSANRLEEAGAHLVYGVVGYKVHAKMILVVRQEDNAFRNYVHLGTGNYHSRTAKFYTDYGLFTCDPAIGEDVHRIFLEITSLGKPLKLNKVLDSPFNLAAALTAKIEREAHNALAGKPARLIAKMNQVTEPGIIQSLYQASRAGVKIDLIVRGMCSLRPGIPEVSENIRVRSIVGRFLEHTRVLYFHNDGHPEMYCTSADWMYRNLHRRVETCFPIEAARLRKRLMQELEYYLEDNTNAWELLPDGTYQKVEQGDRPAVAAQSILMEKLVE